MELSSFITGVKHKLMKLSWISELQEKFYMESFHWLTLPVSFILVTW